MIIAKEMYDIAYKKEKEIKEKKEQEKKKREEQEKKFFYEAIIEEIQEEANNGEYSLLAWRTGSSMEEKTALEVLKPLEKQGFFIIKEIDENDIISIFVCWRDYAFEVFNGNINCSNNELTSLERCKTKKIPGYFDCSFNKLLSLKGAPEEVGVNFDCSINHNLTSLEGAPKIIGEDFNCMSTGLTSLKGAPEEVGGYFICLWCPNLPKEEIIEYSKKYPEIKIKSDYGNFQNGEKIDKFILKKGE